MGKYGNVMAAKKAEREAADPSLSDDSPKIGGGEASGMTGEVKGARNKTLQDRLAKISSKIMCGQFSVELDADQAIESVGSDRLHGWEDDEEFTTLKENIRVRGQTQPIRVRPADPDWKPTENDPTHIPPDAQFYVQSGRRRLAACRQLGIRVLAIIASGSSTFGDQGSGYDEKALSDLEERFAENTIRKSLTPLERMLSIGQIAFRLKAEEDLKQSEIGRRLHVKQAEVSQALKLWRDWEAGGESKEWFSNTSSMIVLRDYIPQIGKGRDTAEVVAEIARRGGVQSNNPDERAPEEGATPKLRVPQAKPKLQRHALFNGSSFSVGRSATGIKLSAKALVIPEDQQEAFERDLKALLERYQGA